MRIASRGVKKTLNIGLFSMDFALAAIGAEAFNSGIGTAHTHASIGLHRLQYVGHRTDNRLAVYQNLKRVRRALVLLAYCAYVPYSAL